MTLPLLNILVVEPFNHSPDLELFDNYEESGFDRRSPLEFHCEYSRDPPVSLGDDNECPAFYYEGMDGNYLDDDIYLEKMNIDNEIADIAGLPAIDRGVCILFSQPTIINYCTVHQMEYLQ